MLFRKRIQRACIYCVHSAKLEDGVLLCAKKGIKGQDDKCFRFRYDPCKRIPVKPRALDFTQYEEADFSL